MTTGRAAALPRHVGLSVEAAAGVVVLRLGTSRFQCDLVPDVENFAIGSRYRGPAYTLDRWVAELNRLAARSCRRVMLPFSFSDQCTGWLRVAPTHDDLVEVQAGWSELGQYDFDGSKFVAVGRSLPDFTPVKNARIERRLADIIAAVTACREELAVRLNPDGAIAGERNGGEG